MFATEEGLSALPTEHLEAEIESLAAQINVSTARWLSLLGEYDARDGWCSWGTKSLAEWVAWRCGLEPRAAREHVRVARALRELPLTAARLESGELSFSKARALTRVATPESEEALLEMARHATAAQLERILSAYRTVSREEAEEVNESAFVSATWEPDGSLRIAGRLGPEEGSAFLRALDAAKDALWEEARGGADRAVPDSKYENGSAEPHLELEQAQASPSGADALGFMSESFLARGPAPRTGGERHQVLVHIQADGRTHTEDGVAIAAESAARIACDAAVVEIGEDRDGEPLSVGRRRRTVPAALRRALDARDNGCRFPGCNSRRMTDAHHIVHWSSGGETSKDNLVLLCRHHHRLVHEGGFSLEPGPGGDFVFRDPRGRTLKPSPVPPSPDAPLAPGHPPAAHGGPAPIWRGTGERMDLGLCVDAVIAAQEGNN
jgi:hypothetical protein